ncbi:MAG: hypothetical protein Q8Q04_02855 [archaeon]|nr:hypothetical protein [archaeon]
MSLVGKLKNSLALLVLAGSLIPFGFGNSQNLHSQGKFFWETKKEVCKKNEDKKIALALITTYDPPKASKGIEEMFKANFSELPEYKLYTNRTTCIEDLTKCIEVHSKEKKIDALVLAYHGDKYSFRIDSSHTIDTTNVEEIFRKYSDSFSKDAIIILYSCSTGSGEDNIAKRLSDVLDRDVVAPRLGLIPETYLEPWQRMGEFALDDNGRISFDYDNFKRYLDMYYFSAPSNSVATYSYKLFRGKFMYKKGGKDLFFFSDKNPK